MDKRNSYTYQPRESKKNVKHRAIKPLIIYRSQVPLLTFKAVNRSWRMTDSTIKVVEVQSAIFKIYIVLTGSLPQVELWFRIQ